ncbi:unnamed protein product [Anisakis simplex]|uniref:30S ribosomal protein S18 n=1 Tax=Anisakis simplex TaxID=6269 RepID=A0A0M3KAJ4_ANISI|nr:unnamed protein product [Anisakis simplex]
MGQMKDEMRRQMLFKGARRIDRRQTDRVNTTQETCAKRNSRILR